MVASARINSVNTRGNKRRKVAIWKLSLGNEKWFLHFIFFFFFFAQNEKTKNNYTESPIQLGQFVDRCAYCVRLVEFIFLLLIDIVFPKRERVENKRKLLCKNTKMIKTKFHVAFIFVASPLLLLVLVSFLLVSARTFCRFHLSSLSDKRKKHTVSLCLLSSHLT